MYKASFISIFLGKMMINSLFYNKGYDTFIECVLQKGWLLPSFYAILILRDKLDRVLIICQKIRYDE